MDNHDDSLYLVESDDDDENPCGFYEQQYSFGIRKKKYLSKSDFSIELQDFVSAKHLTGYVCKVTRAVDSQSR